MNFLPEASSNRRDDTHDDPHECDDDDDDDDDDDERTFESWCHRRDEPREERRRSKTADDDDEDGTRRVSLVFFVVSSRDDEKEDDVENESATTGTDVARGRGVFDDEEDGIERGETRDATKGFDEVSGTPRGSDRAIRVFANLVRAQNGLANKTGVVDGSVVVSVDGERTCGESVRVHLTRCSFGNEFTQEGLGSTHAEFRSTSAGIVCVCGDWKRRGPTLNATERTSAGFGRVGERRRHSFGDEL